MSGKTRLYGFTRDHIFPYYCFGKKCYSFGIYCSKLRRCFAKYGFKTDTDEVLHTMMHNSNPIRFFGIIKTDKKTMYDLFND